MKRHLLSTFIFMGIIFPSFILSGCSDKNEYVYHFSRSGVWLGVQVNNISEQRLKNLNLDYGVEISRVYSDSPAEEAGLKKDDILLTINESPITDSNKMIDMVRAMRKDEKIKITYLREGKEQETTATIDKDNTDAWRNKQKEFVRFVSEKKYPWLGVLGDNLTDQLRIYFNVPEGLGVLVKEIAENSPAEKYGIKAGDIILRIGEKKVNDTHDLMRAINRYNSGDEIEITIFRDGQEKTIQVTLGERKGQFIPQFMIDPEKFNVHIPDIKIEIPEMDIEVPEIDSDEIDELDQKIRTEFEEHMQELNEHLKELKEKLQELKLHRIHEKSNTI